MKNPLRTQLDLFAPAIPPAKMSSEERVKAVMLLQSLLVEAASAPGTGLSGRSRKEAGDEQDHR
ncbi:hypothetical protein [Mesorhizobium captivum]|uniref:hypothetical protein n=1 Tax=Mesorhizobium captivum TaxID=3072319 RepID=UPI002A24577A|nr:hypothetical protein [Mesorhizobium sp. VK23E]MDX8514654.1 hypothetical protein [Mesorhizobium sp. VK23E]